jgi:hypothetical protein
MFRKIVAVRSEKGAKKVIYACGHSEEHFGMFKHVVYIVKVWLFLSASLLLTDFNEDL